MERLEEFIYKLAIRMSNLSDSALLAVALLFCAMMFVLTAWILFY